MAMDYESKLVRSISSENLVALGEVVGDSIIDSLMDNKLLHDIPLIGLVTKLYAVSQDIRTHTFLKKVYKFLYEINEVPISDRQQFVAQLHQNPTKEREFGESIILLLDRADHVKKASILGKLIGAMMEGKIEQDIALRLCSMVDKAYYSDLEYLASEFEQGRPKSAYKTENLERIGLVAKTTLSEQSLGTHYLDINAEVNDEYELSYFGQLLIQYGFSK